jgi:hypothetical protein
MNFFDPDHVIFRDADTSKRRRYFGSKGLKAIWYQPQKMKSPA